MQATKLRISVKTYIWEIGDKDGDERNQAGSFGRKVFEYENVDGFDCGSFDPSSFRRKETKPKL